MDLSVAILLGSGLPNTAIIEQLETIPNVRVISKSQNFDDFFHQHWEEKPDLIIVDLNNLIDLPSWLEDLTRRFTNIPVMVWSANDTKDFLIRAMQLGVREFLSVPVAQADLEAALERVYTAKISYPSDEAGSGQLVAVASLKGGAGVTSVAVNLAVALAEICPDRVALVDLGRPFPDVAHFLHQQRKTCLLDLIENEDQLDRSMILRTMQPHQAGMMLLHGCPKFKGMDLIKPAIMEKVWIRLRPLYEWIIVDLGHWLDEVFFATANKADRLILLTGQTIPDLHNLRDLLMLFQHQGLKTEKVNVIINRYQKGKSVDLKELESIQHHPVFFTLPGDDKSLMDSINHGIPLGEMSPRSKLSRSLRSLAQELIHSREAVTGAAPMPPPKARRWFLFF